MNIKIYGENELQPPHLRLVRDHGTIYLAAVWADGSGIPSGYLMYLNPDGVFIRCGNVSKDVGLPLDKKSRIKVL